VSQFYAEQIQCIAEVETEWRCNTNPHVPSFCVLVEPYRDKNWYFIGCGSSEPKNTNVITSRALLVILICYDGNTFIG